MVIVVEIFFDPDTGKQILVWKREVAKTRTYGFVEDTHTQELLKYFSSYDSIGYCYGRFRISHR